MWAIRKLGQVAWMLAAPVASCCAAAFPGLTAAVPAVQESRVITVGCICYIASSCGMVGGAGDCKKHGKDMPQK